MRPVRCALVAVALTLVACGNDDDSASTSATNVTSPSIASDASTSTAAKASSSSSAVDVIRRMNDSGFSCVMDSKDSNVPGAGAASLEFCEADAHTIQVVTFADDTGKKDWLDLAAELGTTDPDEEFVCVVGSDFAACPAPGPGSKQVGASIQSAIGGEVRQLNR